MPVIPATQETEEEPLAPGRQKLWWAEIAPLHSSLGNKSKTVSKKKNFFKKQKYANNHPQSHPKKHFIWENPSGFLLQIHFMFFSKHETI